MRALEFKSKIKDNQILVPSVIQSELNASKNKDIRVIVLIDDPEPSNDFIFRQSAKTQFLEGYADLDSIYDSK